MRTLPRIAPIAFLDRRRRFARPGRGRGCENPRPALARRRRARHGKRDRPGHLGALRALPREPEGEGLRGLAGPLEHDADVAVCRPLRREGQADLGAARHGARVQQRDVQRRRRARAGRHADRRARPLCVLQAALGRQGRAAARPGELLRRLHAEGREAHARLAAVEARHGEGAADHHHRGAARCEGAGRQGPADEGGRNGHRRAHRGDAEGAGPRQARHPAGRRGLRAHRLGRSTGRIPTSTRSITARRRASPTTPRSTWARAASSRSASTRPSSTPWPRACCRARAAPRPARRPACRSRSTTT